MEYISQADLVYKLLKIEIYRYFILKSDLQIYEQKILLNYYSFHSLGSTTKYSFFNN